MVSLALVFPSHTNIEIHSFLIRVT